MMNYTKLYEVTNLNIDFTWFIPYIILISVLIFTKIVSHKNQDSGEEKCSKSEIIFLIKIICLSFAIIALFFCIITTLVFWSQYNSIVVPYKNGNYQIVEGYVEDYIPAPYIGRGYKESFKVGDIKFEYSDYEVNLGYNCSASHGGIISKNGERVRIGYVNYRKNNIIVSIEKAN